MSKRKSGVFLSYMAQIVQILSALVYTPIMLKILGQSEYGLYQLVYSVVSYLSLLSLGFASSYIRFYSRYKVSEKDDEIKNLNGIFMLLFLLMSTICILCGIIMTNNLGVIFGNGLNSKEMSKAKILISIMVFNMAVTFPTSVFDCYIVAHEEFVFQKLIAFLQSLLSPFVSLPLLLLGYNSIGLVVVTTFFTVLKFIVNAFFCIKKLHMKFSISNIKRELLFEMSKFTFFIFLNQVVDQINWSVDKFLIGRISGTISVAIYGLGAQINTLYLMLSSSISSMFVPEVNKMVANKEGDKKISDIFIRVGRIQYIIVLLILSGYFFFGKTFMILWGGNDYKYSYYVALLLITPVTVPLIQNLGIEILRAKNMHKARSIVYCIIAIANIYISILLIKRFDYFGAALGTTIALFAGNILFMNWYYWKKIKLDILLFWKNIFIMTICMIPAFFVGGICKFVLSQNNIIYYIIQIMVYTLVYCIVCYLVCMNNYEKNIIKSILKRGNK